ncbi:hypothetical protein [Paenibacillus rigui]|uniref:hypothetical protein n=1 Tax=Paenibacillus rigui TaxID=554312 RepID=UPI001180F68C|nr:hypothetical protein [Paenibacillus rigui]
MQYRSHRSIATDGSPTGLQASHSLYRKQHGALADQGKAEQRSTASDVSFACAAAWAAFVPSCSGSPLQAPNTRYGAA